MDQNPRLRWACALALFLVTLAVYLPALGCDFVNWDDPVNFLNNPNYRGLGWQQLRWMWTNHLSAHYIPLSWITLGFDYTLWGMDATGYHLTNILMHSLNVAVFFLLALRLIGEEGWAERSGAMMAAVLFGIHPLRAESVAWVTERRDELSGLFLLLTALAYLKWGGEGRRRDYWIAFGCFVAGVLSKEITIMMVPVLVALDVWPLRRIRSGIGVWVEKVPFTLVAAASAIATIYFGRMEGTVSSVANVSMLARVQVACYHYIFHIRKTLLPFGLSPFYAYSPAKYAGLRFAAGVVFLGCLAAVVVLARKRYPGVVPALAAYIFLLLPVSGLFQSGPQLAADRYSYAPCLALALVMGGAWTLLWKRFEGDRAKIGAMCVAALVVVGALSFLTVRQVLVWSNSESLWQHAYSLEPSPEVHEYLGLALLRDGNAADAKLMFQKGIELDPTYYGNHAALGAVWLGDGEVDRAILEFEAAVQYQPQSPRMLLYLAKALSEKGWREEALRRLEQARRMAPDFPAIDEEIARIQGTHQP